MDGDTSTNDTLAVLANGEAGNPPLAPTRPLHGLQQALTAVCLDLAQQIVRDDAAAQAGHHRQRRGLGRRRSPGRKGGRPFAAGQDGPLRRRRQLGSHPGRRWLFGTQVDPERVALHFGSATFNLTPLQVVAAGQPLPYDEAATAAAAQPEIEVLIELGLGAFATVSGT